VNAQHPNVALFGRLNLRDLQGCTDLFAEDFVWHYVNPLLPDVHGDYVGVSGLQRFFDKIRARTKETFIPRTVSVATFGDELVVLHNKNRLTIDGKAIETDVALVWRVVDGRFAEVWDILSVHTEKELP
jgi:ketosteroid isomerase-like protein